MKVNMAEINFGVLPWTERQEITELDKKIIRIISEKNPVAARIFLTGEVAVDNIGHIAGNFLVNANDAVPESLFTLTKANTIKMERFEPHLVWSCINPRLIEWFIHDEEKRLGLNIVLDYWDFYQCVIASLYKKTGSIYCFPVLPDDGSVDSWYKTCYLGGLLLFHKPGLMDVPVSRYFAVSYPEKIIGFYLLSSSECAELEKIKGKNKSTAAYRNEEFDFLAKLTKKTTKTEVSLC